MVVSVAPKPQSKLITDGSIEGSSFTQAETIPKKRLIVAIDGDPKTGKSHLALSAPGPIAYQNIDNGLEGVKHKFDSEKVIHVANYDVPIPYNKDNALPLWLQFVNDYRAALAAKVRTVVWDTASEAWPLLRMARLGALTQILPVQYTASNAEFSGLLRLARQSDTNLILLSRVKDEYLQDARTGKKVRAGFGDIEFEADVVLKTSKRTVLKAGQEKFTFKVMDCRHNPDIEGKEFEGAECNFPALAKAIFPESSEGDWL